MPPNLVRVMPDSTLLPMLVNTLLQHVIIRITISCIFLLAKIFFKNPKNIYM